MTHPDADDLALLALGEALSPQQEAHLADCPACAEELRRLRAAVALGRSSAGEERLVPPAPHVWAAVQDELGTRPPAVRRRRRPRRAVLIGVAAAVVVALVAALAPLVLGAVERRSPEVLATAELTARPAWPGADGTAQLERLADGRLVIRVRVRTPAVDGAYRELWLLGASSRAVSLGVVDEDDAVYAVPADIDLARFDVVDVSREPPDGDPAHSSDSIVRGRLRPGAA